MGGRTRWTIRVEKLRTRLMLGEGRQPQPVEVSLVIHGLFEAQPRGPSDAMDLQALCNWITGAWSSTDPTPVLSMRVNEVLAYVFAADARVQEVTASICCVRSRSSGAVVGVERQARRSQFTAQLRLARD